jgi:hypothetical protein
MPSLLAIILQSQSKAGDPLIVDSAPDTKVRDPLAPSLRILHKRGDIPNPQDDDVLALRAIQLPSTICFVAVDEAIFDVKKHSTIYYMPL